MEEKNPMIITKRQELSPGERKMPLAKYFDLPLYDLGPRERQILDAGPVDPKTVVKAENYLDLLQPTGYQKVEYGYSRMPDGSAYFAVYSVYPNCTPQMLGWWFRWLNIRPKSQPKGTGTLKYKIWNPADHWDHGFINGKDESEGIYNVETLDLGEGEGRFRGVRIPWNLRDFGLSAEREQALKAAGCWVHPTWYSFYEVEPPHKRLPGAFFCVTLSRKNPFGGGAEKCSHLWVGWGVKDGKLVRDKSTPEWMLSEEYLKKTVTHATIEAQHMTQFLPQLYAEYKDQPDDAD